MVQKFLGILLLTINLPHTGIPQEYYMQVKKERVTSINMLGLHEKSECYATSGIDDASTQNAMSWLPKPYRYKKTNGKIENFWVAGLNHNIKELTSITLRSINHLDQLAKDEATEQVEKELCLPGTKISSTGFINKKEKFLDVLKIDNDYVLKEGLTHQQIAYPLLVLIREYTKKCKKENEKAFTFEKNYYTEINIDQSVFQIESEVYEHKPTPNFLLHLVFNVPIQISPSECNNPTKCLYFWYNGDHAIQGTIFNDQLYFKKQLTLVIKNKIGTKIKIDQVTPHLIYRYGFYQGNNGFRRSPKELIEFFGKDWLMSLKATNSGLSAD